MKEILCELSRLFHGRGRHAMAPQTHHRLLLRVSARSKCQRRKLRPRGAGALPVGELVSGPVVATVRPTVKSTCGCGAAQPRQHRLEVHPARIPCVGGAETTRVLACVAHAHVFVGGAPQHPTELLQRSAARPTVTTFITRDLALRAVAGRSRVVEHRSCPFFFASEDSHRGGSTPHGAGAGECLVRSHKGEAHLHEQMTSCPSQIRQGLPKSE